MKWRSFSITNLLSLGFVVVSVFAVSFGPFIYMASIEIDLSAVKKKSQDEQVAAP